MAKRKRTQAEDRSIAADGKVSKIAKTSAAPKPGPSPILLDLVRSFLKSNGYSHTVRALNIDAQMQKHTKEWIGTSRGLPQLPELYKIWADKRPQGFKDVNPNLTSESPEPDVSDSGDSEVDTKGGQKNAKAPVDVSSRGSSSVSDSESESSSSSGTSVSSKSHKDPLVKNPAKVAIDTSTAKDDSEKEVAAVQPSSSSSSSGESSDVSSDSESESDSDSGVDANSEGKSTEGKKAQKIQSSTAGVETIKEKGKNVEKSSKGKDVEKSLSSSELSSGSSDDDSVSSSEPEAVKVHLVRKPGTSKGTSVEVKKSDAKTVKKTEKILEPPRAESTSLDSSDSSSTSDSDSSSDSESSAGSSSSKGAGDPVVKVKATTRTKLERQLKDKDESDQSSDESTSSSDSEPESEMPPSKAKSKLSKSGPTKAISHPPSSESSATIQGSPVKETTASKKASPPTEANLKRKRDSPSTSAGPQSSNQDSAGNGNGKRLKGINQPFSRIPKDQTIDPRFASNKYIPYDYADRAHEALSVTKGKGFTKEKNKKKRGSYRGGVIDTTPKGIKFED
ncbi:MAG: hypothetical protein M1820_000401 [Bogoriella megaspora]|nr:MAG: hypothetical protein M1820_000401 [Bogoriella megaspora]